MFYGLASHSSAYTVFRSSGIRWVSVLGVDTLRAVLWPLVSVHNGCLSMYCYLCFLSGEGPSLSGLFVSLFITLSDLSFRNAFSHCVALWGVLFVLKQLLLCCTGWPQILGHQGSIHPPASAS